MEKGPKIVNKKFSFLGPLLWTYSEGDWATNWSWRCIRCAAIDYAFVVILRKEKRKRTKFAWLGEFLTFSSNLTSIREREDQEFVLVSTSSK